MTKDYISNTGNHPVPDEIIWEPRSGNHARFDWADLRWLWRPHPKQRGGSMWVYDSAEQWPVVRLRVASLTDAERVIRDFYAGAPLKRFKPEGRRRNNWMKSKSRSSLETENQAYHDWRAANA